MRAPEFWRKSVAESLAVRVLRPVGLLYRRIVQRRLARAPSYYSRLPVICVGNMTMGGSGKTPVVQAIVQILQEQGLKPAILLRGYGGKGRGPFWVTPEMAASHAGDEALLHARIAPTLVSADRVAGARRIEQGDFTHIVMDDGLQNPTLAKRFSVLVVDGGNPAGNGHVFPAGPLRETLADILPRVQVVVLLGRDITELKTRLTGQKPLITAHLAVHDADKFADLRCVAFAGIGQPDKFFHSLRDSGAVIAESRSFADHHPYTDGELQELRQLAARHDAQLVTTRKDWVRLPPEIQLDTLVLDVALAWDEPDAMASHLAALGLI